jgi:hypothetical protein
VRSPKEGIVGFKPLWILFLFAFLASLLLVGFGTQRQEAASGKMPLTSRLPVTASNMKQPLSFEVNRGQTDPQVKFISRGRGYALFLTSTEAVVSVRKAGDRLKNKNGRATSADARHDDIIAGILRMKLLGANPVPDVSGLKPLPGRSNYFRGSDPSKWHTHVPTYAAVQYKDVYPGIDLIYYGNHEELEYDWLVAPGADPKLIKLAIQGADKISLDAHHDLRIESSGIEMRLHKPVVYQVEEGRQKSGSNEGENDRAKGVNLKRLIEGNYIVKGDRTVAFDVAAYDSSKPLIIDPILSYSSYLGGNDEDESNAIAIDSTGNAYITGSTVSSDFPTKNPLQAGFHGLQDAFVAKFNPAISGSASLLYSTYLGSSDGNAFGLGIAVDSAGNAYVTGGTASTNFPTTPGAFQTTAGSQGDAFVTKLDSTGSALVYSTYLGGGGNNDQGLGIAVDTAGDANVTGFTDSLNFPTKNSFQPIFGGGFSDAFVTKLNATGSALIYSTYLGGSSADCSCVNAGVAVDGAGSIYVTGRTSSSDFPTTLGVFQTTLKGGSDAFVAKFDPTASGAASLVYSTHLGSDASGAGIAVDATGNAYVTGITGSTDFPTTSSAFQKTMNGVEDTFVSKLNATGSALVFSTLLGGSFIDQSNAVSVDSSGNVYVAGVTQSTNFPVTSDAFRSSSQTTNDAFVTKLNSDASSLIFSTYLGGTNLNIARGIAVDAAGNAFVSGYTRSPDFPTMNAFQPMCASCTTIFPISPTTDAFVSKITFTAPGTPDFSLSASPSSSTIAAGQSTSFSLTVTPSNGFNQMVALNCSEQAAASSCSISPSSVTLDGVKTSTATINITTTARSMFVPKTKPFPLTLNLRIEMWVLLLVAFAVLMRLKRELRRGSLTLAVALFLVMFSTACGGGSGSGNGGGGQPGTKVGNYTITLTGTSGNLTHFTNATLVVN